MANIVVADTGPLIALALIDLLSVTSKLFSEVIVPDAVIDEACVHSDKPGAVLIKAALEQGILVPASVSLTPEFEHLSQVLDRGEAEALALSLELGAVALIDERRGRRVATAHGIKVIGTAAVLVRAKQQGFIDAVKPLVELLNHNGYRLSDGLIEAVLASTGEKL